jgi:hypothetical protein
MERLIERVGGLDVHPDHPTRGRHEPGPCDLHLATWAGLCPGNNESAGKHKSGKTGRGDPRVRAALT